MAVYTVKPPADDAVGESRVWIVLRDGEPTDITCDSDVSAFSHAAVLELKDLDDYLLGREKISKMAYHKAEVAFRPLMDVLRNQALTGVPAARPRKTASIDDTFTFS
ncbi:hypothetical protein [Pseudomonas sp. TWI929]|uniref:hypothetical protein n=1 Tax=Pseudomonas sp. TWI929 TaxID=3136795 RepID=UPI00320ABAC2